MILQKKNKINILGGTHYSTKTFACIAIVEYFEKMGLVSEVIKNIPGVEDL